MSQQAYEQAKALAQEAFQLCLQGELYHALEVLHRVRNELKQLSGDLPIAIYSTTEDVSSASSDVHFITRTFAEAQAWGWLEFASGVFKLMQERPGGSLVHFTRAWRIWRLWSSQRETSDSATIDEARRERARAGLWLGEAWARCISDRALYSARAVLRAALAELARTHADDLLQETIDQQALLPPAGLGSPAYKQNGLCMPYVSTLIPRQNDKI
jgi:hypothetical protein